MISGGWCGIPFRFDPLNFTFFRFIKLLYPSIFFAIFFHFLYFIDKRSGRKQQFQNLGQIVLGWLMSYFYSFGKVGVIVSDYFVGTLTPTTSNPFKFLVIRLLVHVRRYNKLKLNFYFSIPNFLVQIKK